MIATRCFERLFVSLVETNFTSLYMPTYNVPYFNGHKIHSFFYFRIIIDYSKDNSLFHVHFLLCEVANDVCNQS